MTTEIPYDTLKAIHERLLVAQRAIKLYRKTLKPKNIAHGRTRTFVLTYGCFGLLDWVRTGDYRTIMVPDLERYVRIALALGSECSTCEKETCTPILCYREGIR